MISKRVKKSIITPEATILEKRFKAIRDTSDVVKIVLDSKREHWLCKIPNYRYYSENNNVFNELHDDYSNHIPGQLQRFEFLARRECLSAFIHMQICGANSVPTLSITKIKQNGGLNYTAVASKFISTYKDWSNVSNENKLHYLRNLIYAGLASLLVADLDFHPNNFGVDASGNLIKVDFGCCLDEGIIDSSYEIQPSSFDNIFTIEGLFRGFGEDLKTFSESIDYDTIMKSALNDILVIDKNVLRNKIKVIMGNQFPTATSILEKTLISHINNLQSSATNYLKEKRIYHQPERNNVTFFKVASPVISRKILAEKNLEPNKTTKRKFN